MLPRGITGDLRANPNPLSFNPQPYYYGGQQQGLNLENSNGTASTQVAPVTITGPDAGHFYVAYGQNCATQLINANGSCGMGIGFDGGGGPGVFNAQAEIASDAGSSPLIVPLSATPLNGGHLTVSPNPVSFGDVGIGQEASRTVTMGNDGDAPLQFQQVLVVTGRPDVFFVTDDACSTRTVNPGESCTLVTHFKPTRGGDQEAALFAITGNNPPVGNVGMNGNGVAPAPPGLPGAKPAGVANLLGSPENGNRLTCQPVGYSESTGFGYAWLRNGKVIPGETGPSLRLGNADVGSRMACLLSASSSGGGQVVRSPESAPVTPLDLSREPGAFTDDGTCRTVSGAHSVRLGRDTVTIDHGSPATPWAPFRVHSRSSLTLSIDGRRVASGRVATVSTRALAGFADGRHTLELVAGGRRTQSTLGLSRCRLALRVDGGPRQPATIAVSARTGLGTTTIQLPHGLRLHTTRGRKLGQVSVRTARLPARVYDLVGPRTVANGVTITLSHGGLRVSGLPAQTGVVRFSLRAGVLSGRRGIASARSVLAGDSGATASRMPVSWLR